MTYDSTILAESNLIAYYKLNETSGTTAVDSTSNAYNGTLHGGITLNQSSLASGLDPCMLFDGSSGYISLPSGVEVAEPISIEMWVKPSSLGAGGNILYGVNDGSGHGYEHGIEGTPSSNFYVSLNAGGTNGGSAFATGTVYYTCYTIDTSQNATGYTGPVGGTVTQQVTGNPGGSLSYGSTVPYVGARYRSTGPSLYFAGNISSVAIYNKVLTTTQMNNHITAASSGTTVTKSLPMRLALRVQKTRSLPMRLPLRVQSTRSLPMRFVYQQGAHKSVPMRLVLVTAPIIGESTILRVRDGKTILRARDGNTVLVAR